MEHNWNFIITSMINLIDASIEVATIHRKAGIVLSGPKLRREIIGRVTNPASTSILYQCEHSSCILKQQIHECVSTLNVEVLLATNDLRQKLQKAKFAAGTVEDVLAYRDKCLRSALTVVFSIDLEQSLVLYSVKPAFPHLPTFQTLPTLNTTTLLCQRFGRRILNMLIQRGGTKLVWFNSVDSRCCH
jgi:hypothetical protein